MAYAARIDEVYESFDYWSSGEIVASAQRAFQAFVILDNVDVSEPLALEAEEMANAATAERFQWRETLSLIGAMLVGGLVLYGFIDTKIDAIRTDMSDLASNDAISELRAEMQKNREETTRQFELLRQEMREDRATMTNAILDLQRQQGRLSQPGS